MNPLRPLLLLCLLGSAALGAQMVEYGQGQLIVQLRGEVDGKLWAYRQPELYAWKSLGRSLNTLLVNFDWRQHAEDSLRLHYTRDPAVLNVQLNHRLSFRRRPDDPRYAQQWQLSNTGQTGGPAGSDYKLESAWEFTTGGVTPNGDTIVIASIDNGIDLDHDDLRDNLWINRDEIPGNGLDDDRNGYVDDVYGWNTALESNDVEGGKGDHGTPVMGQIGASGNNGLGVTGVNWNIKVMSVTNDFDPLESEVIQAYTYALDARKRYDATGGREGAYVVATNASWGRDRAFPSQSPIWCAIYDSLGHHGILNIAAVPNQNVDVEEVGDLPSLCGSEYLMIVTNLDDRDRKVTAAARGATSVDLGAYGEGVYTTLLGNSYGAVFGTSFATPAVTGAVGLLYSAPCPGFGDLLASDPAAAARYVRDAVYTNVRPVDALQGQTATGGRLDIGSAMTAVMNDCANCQPPTSFTAIRPDDLTTDLILEWKEVAAITSTRLRYRPAGTTAWLELENVESPFRLTGLPACSRYELQLVSRCGNETVRTEPLVVETPGCCRLPDDLRVEALSGARLQVSWTPLLTAVSYTLRYRSGTEAWTELTTTDSRLEITGLRNCRSYTLELRTNCTGNHSGFRGRRTIKTLGCGVCLDTQYCTPAGSDNEQEWIARVDLPGVLTNESGRDASGYANFGDLTQAAVVPGGVYPTTLASAFRGSGFTEDFHVYVDWNQDGSLAEDELVLQKSASRGTPASGLITVPPTAKFGLTRMRVVMQFGAVSTDACPTDSGSPRGGEIEDYCLDVTPVQGCPPPAAVEATYSEEANTTTLSWGASAAPGNRYRLRYRERTTPNYTEVQVEGLTATVAGLNLCSSYEIQIASLCDDGVGGYRTVFLGDDCVSDRPVEVPDRLWSLFPNPAGVECTLSWEPQLSVAELAIYAVDGRRVWEAIPERASGRMTVPTGTLSPGLYLFRLTADDGSRGTKRLIVHR